MRLRSLALATLTLLPSLALAQTTPNYTTTITLAHLLNGAANVPFASVCATPVDGYDAPITVSAPTWGLIGKNSHFCASVVNGAFGTGGLPVPDAAHTNALAPILYDITIQPTDSTGKAAGVAIQLPKVPNISGATYALDSFAPTVSIPAPASKSIDYGPGVPSSCTSPSIFTTNANDGVAYKCVAGTYQLLAGGTGGGPSAPVPVFTGSGPGHAAGIVPDPGATAGTSRFLNESGSFTTLPVQTGGGSSLSVQVGGTAVAVQSLLNFKVFTGANLTITPDNAGGLTFNVPQVTLASLGAAPVANPIFTGGVSIQNPNTSYGLLMPLVAAAANSTAFPAALIPNNVTVFADPATTAPAGRLFQLFLGSCPGPGYLSLSSLGNATTQGCGGVFGGSGTTHSAGLVPDPGAVAGATRFLREDNTFAVPAAPASAGSDSGTIIYDKSYFADLSDFNVNGNTTSVDALGRIVLGNTAVGALNSQMIALKAGVSALDRYDIEVDGYIGATAGANFTINRTSVNTGLPQGIGWNFTPNAVQLLDENGNFSSSTIGIKLDGQKNTACTFGANDKFRIIATQRGIDYVGFVYDETTRCADHFSLRASIDSSSGSGFSGPNSAAFTFATLGGPVLISQLTITSRHSSNPDVCFVGNSKDYGDDAATYEAGYTRRIKSLGVVETYAGGGDRVAEILQDLPFLLKTNCKQYVLSAPRNDYCASPATPNWQAGFTTEVNAFVATGAKVALMLPIPETACSDATQAVYTTFANTTFPSLPKIDPSIGFVKATMLTGPGVHPNDPGDGVIANDIKISNVLQIPAVLRDWSPIPALSLYPLNPYGP